jgi:anhydro-N-acetylmuramic acid kinase
MSVKTFHAIGLMSGSSLDGLDIAYVKFTVENNQWNFNILKYECLEYPPPLLQKIKTAKQLSIEEFYKLHTQLGHYYGSAVKNFCSTNHIIQIDVVASHGHTVFHDPESMVTCQIGCGAAIAASSGFKTVSDLRAIDIAYRGQGAPIVPIGDRLLFSEYDAWLNIGGIANITLKNNDNYIAYDIASANQILNHYAKKLGKDFDDNGFIASTNKVQVDCFEKLNLNDYYTKSAPKSLDNSFSNHIIQVLDAYNISTEEKIATYTEHLAFQIAKQTNGAKKLLATGGGAFNSFLIKRIESYTACEIIVPSKEIIAYKEALVMALIGVLRIEHNINTYSSVTGAIKDSIGGAVYIP